MDSMYTESEYLEHFGKKGMKWGVRNDEKSGATKATRTPEQIAARRKKLLIIGGSAVAVVLASAVAYSVYKGVKVNGKVNADLLTRAQGDHPINWKVKDALKHDMSLVDLKKNVVAPINPGFGKPGTKNNCMRATFAYELRRRGMDVRSTVIKDDEWLEQTNLGRTIATRTATAFPPDSRTRNIRTVMGIKEFTDSTKKLVGGRLGENEIKIFDDYTHGSQSRIKTAESIMSALSKEPNGARGELGIGNMFSGHSMAWEVIKGKPVVIDAQSGEIFDTAKKLTARTAMLEEAAYTRLDNLTMNHQFLERWLTDAA